MKVVFSLILLFAGNAFGCDACRDSDVLRDDLQGAFQNYGAPPAGVSISSTPKAVPEEFSVPRERTQATIEASVEEPVAIEPGTIAPRQAASGGLPTAKRPKSFLRSFQDF